MFETRAKLLGIFPPALEKNSMAHILYRSSVFILFLLAVTFLSHQSCAPRADEINSAAADVTSDTPAEREIRAGYCDNQHKNYAGAQSHFSKALELDPKQKYAQFLIATMLEKQFKPGDKSPENLAIARQAIAAYQKTIDNPNSDSAMKEDADKEIVVLYGHISREEQERELLARATSPARYNEKRAEAYTVLADLAWDCSYKITESSENKRPMERGGKTIIQYVRPKDPTLLENARTCATSGLEYANQAITLNPNDSSAWSSKENVLRELAKLAEMSGDIEKKLKFEKQVAETKAVRDRLYAEESKQAEERAEQQTKKPDSLSVDNLTYEQLKSLTIEEFTYFKSEPTISKLVEEMRIDLLPTGPIAPASEDERTDRRTQAEAALQLKRDWKQFRPAGEHFSAMMPDPVQQNSDGEMKMYDSSSEGITYGIFSLERHELPELPSKYDQATYDTMVLNTTIHATAALLTNFLLRSDAGAVVEVKLARKEPVSGRQTRQYAVTMTSCDKTTKSVLNYYAGSKHTYIVLIRGADENDPRAQQFLRSWRIS
ncbi:MAG: hypothetical protein M3R69_07825 [Acidobacteriota bacterium]|nr:hypothetical protein [Acidobacteriota bacterium]